MITYRKGHEVDIIRLAELLKDSGYENIADDCKSLFKMVEESGKVLIAWDFDYMIGFINTERGQNSIRFLLVDNEYRNMGIEKEFRDRILNY